MTVTKIRITDNVQFNASESVSETQGDIIWEFGDVLTDDSDQSVVNHNYSKPGSYTVNLTVKDSTGASRNQSQIVNVTIPVVLVHGFRSSSAMWQGMYAGLQEEGFEVWNFDYQSSNTADPRTISPKLAAFIEENRSDLSYNGQEYTGKIDIVCHSMGAIVSRLYMEKDEGGVHGKDVRQWIGIAPAHGGAASADVIDSAVSAIPEWDFLKWSYFPALNELKTTSDTVNSLGPLSPNTKYWVIAGWNPSHSPFFGSGLSATYAKSETGSYYWTYSGDKIVATQQSYNENMEFEAFPPANGDLGGSPAYEFDHSHICNSPKVIAYVVDCLKNIDKHSSKQKPPEEAAPDLTFFKKSIEGALGTMKKLITLPLSVPVFGSSSGGSGQMMAMSYTGATVQATEDNVLSVLLDWDQGDVDMSLISPSGVEYTADSHPDNVWFLEEGHSVTAIVVNPESGDWKANLDPVSYPGQDISYSLTSILRTGGSSEQEIMPVANFKANATEGYVPLSVQFTDLSENATSWEWDFGDRSEGSYDQNPVHVFDSAGSYNVSLTISNNHGQYIKTIENYILVESDKSIRFVLKCPVDMEIMDPDGLIISKQINEIPGAVYKETDINNDGDLDDIVLISDMKLGDYKAKVVPEPGAQITDTDTYTLEVSSADNHVILAKDVLVKDNPQVEYVVSSEMLDSIPSPSILNLQSVAGITWINWTWNNPTDQDFNHTEIYLNGIFQTNISTEYFNTTGLQPETSYTIGTRTADINGNMNETWVNLTATTKKAPIIVDVGMDQTVEEGTSLDLKGSFAASGSHTYSYHWDFGEGSVEDSSLTTSHTYADNGVYTVNLTVTDEEGDLGNDTLLVTVNNAIPVVDSGSDITVTAGDLVFFSGIFSDPGWLDTHTAEWTFGEGTTKAGSVSEENEYPDSTGTVSGSFSYFDAGEYTVTLSVTDNDGGIGQDQLTVTVLPIVATVDFDPDTLNLGSGGQWITAYIELPDGYDVAGINASSVLLNGAVSAVTDPKYGFVKDKSEYLKDRDGDGIPERMLKFDRKKVEGILKAGDQVTVTFTGKVGYNNGISSDLASFEGSDLIKVIEKSSKKGNTKK